MKACSKCQRELPADMFAMTTAHGKTYPRADCRDCQSLRSAGWYQRRKRSKRYRKQRAAYMRQWRAGNRDDYNLYAKRRRLKRALEGRAGMNKTEKLNAMIDGIEGVYIEYRPNKGWYAGGEARHFGDDGDYLGRNFKAARAALESLLARGWWKASL